MEGVVVVVFFCGGVFVQAQKDRKRERERDLVFFGGEKERERKGEMGVRATCACLELCTTSTRRVVNTMHSFSSSSWGRMVVIERMRLVEMMR